MSRKSSALGLFHVECRRMQEEPKPHAMKGGKREGAGRKPSADPANQPVLLKLTKSEKAAWEALGATRWLRPYLRNQSKA